MSFMFVLCVLICQKAPNLPLRKRATSVGLQKDMLTGSISRDVVNFPSELCRRRSGMFAEVARLLPPGTHKQTYNQQELANTTNHTHDT